MIVRKCQLPQLFTNGKSRASFLLSVVAASVTLLCAATVPLPSLSVVPRVLAFVSSDSCEWCRLLERRVFASEAWRNWAPGHIDFVRVDLPRGDGALDPDARARNNALADRLGVKGIPTFVVLAEDGETELGRMKVPDSARGLGRDVTPEAFIAAVEEVLGRAKRASPASALTVWRVYRFIPVVALLGIAAFLLVDKSKLPLALRGLKKVLGPAVSSGEGAASLAQPVPVWKRMLAFVLILIAFFLAVL